MKIKDFYAIVHSLKLAKRKGWTERGLVGDSIADHSYGVVVIGWYLANRENVNANKVVEMLLVHDLVMAKMEDVTPATGKYDKKRKMEEKAKKLVAKTLPKNLQKRYLKLFEEFNALVTKEARIAREADKLETLHQGEAYEEKTGRSDILDELLTVYNPIFRTKTGKAIFEELESRHKKRKRL